MVLMARSANKRRPTTPPPTTSTTYPITPPSTGRKSTLILPQSRSTPSESVANPHDAITPPSPISPVPATRIKSGPAKSTNNQQSTQTITTLLTRNTHLLHCATTTTLLLERHGEHVFRAAASRLTLHLNTIRHSTSPWAGCLEEHTSPTLAQILEQYHGVPRKTSLLTAQFAEMLVFEAGLAVGNQWADKARACAVAKKGVAMNVLDHATKVANVKMKARRYYTARYSGLFRERVKKVAGDVVVRTRKAARELRALKDFVRMRKVDFEGMVAGLGEGDKRRCMSLTGAEREAWARKAFAVALQRGCGGVFEDLERGVERARALIMIAWMGEFERKCEELVNALANV